jgi:hypothetical protein
MVDSSTTKLLDMVHDIAHFVKKELNEYSSKWQLAPFYKTGVILNYYYIIYIYYIYYTKVLIRNNFLSLDT